MLGFELKVMAQRIGRTPIAGLEAENRAPVDGLLPLGSDADQDDQSS
jgi:hypothetical protein